MTIKSFVAESSSGFGENLDISSQMNELLNNIANMQNLGSDVTVDPSTTTVTTTDSGTTVNYGTDNSSFKGLSNAMDTSTLASTGNIGGSDTEYLPIQDYPAYPSAVQDTGSVGDKLNNRSAFVDEYLVYPDTLKNLSLNPANINFQFYKRDTKEKSTSIHLPMPDNIQNPSTINWDTNVEMGMMGDVITENLKQTGALENGDVKGTVMGIAGQLPDVYERAKSVAIANGISKAIQTASLGTNNVNASDIMGAVNAKTPNPYRAVMFRGVDFRSFSFTFTLVPFSEEDCELINKIIEKFRSHSYPEYSGAKMFFDYPDECQITYLWETTANKWLNNFKRAVCTGIEVDFAPNGQWSSLRNGFPNMIRLTTKWSEVEIITKADIDTEDQYGQKG